MPSSLSLSLFLLLRISLYSELSETQRENSSKFSTSSFLLPGLSVSLSAAYAYEVLFSQRCTYGLRTYVRSFVRSLVQLTLPSLRTYVSSAREAGETLPLLTVPACSLTLASGARE